MYELRPYQAEAKNAVLSEWDQGHKKTLLVLPTGCGKTVVFASVTEEQVHKGHRVLIMAHCGELLTQASNKLKEASGLDSVLEKAESTSLGSFVPVTVGSVQSLCQEKRLDRFPQDYFQDIVVDEAHHALSNSYQQVLEHFPDANILGVTATPDRGDMKNLGEYFDTKAYEYTMPEAIRDGYLCPIKAQMIPLELDIQNVGLSSGDFSAGDIGCALEPYLVQIANEMAHYCEGRKTVVFLPLIATSQKFCKMLNDVGLRAVEVNGNSDDRAQVLADFENGKYNVLCNSMLLTEGWDCPSVDCIVILRPTKIRSLYCLDEQTEILTQDGWKSDVEVGESVAAFNMETGGIKFVTAMAKVRRPLENGEYFCSIHGQSSDICVTNRHRMVYRTRHGSQWRIMEAQELVDLRDGAKIPVSGHGNFPGVPLTDDELRFIGWVMTDGSINKCNHAISISQSSTQPWLEEIQKYIDGCGFKHNRFIQNPKSDFHRNGDYVCWTISRGKPRGRGDLEPYIAKDMSPALNGMTERQFDVMLEAIALADGRKQKSGKWTQHSYHITKGNRRFIEALQIMGIQRGYRANVTEETNVNGNPIWTVHMKKQDFVYVGSSYDGRPKWEKSAPGVGRCWCVQNELGTLVTRRNGKVAIVGNCQMVGRGMRLSPGKDHLLLLDFLWMTARHDLCRPSALISKDAKIASMIDMQMQSEEDGVDLIEAEEQAERDVLAEREAALARELSEMRRRKRKLVDPLQYALSIAAEDLTNYAPTFVWEMAPPSEKQLEFLERRGIFPDSVSNAGLASLLIDRLKRRQDMGLATPKQIRCLERYGFKQVGTWQFDDASRLISQLADNRWRVPYGITPALYRP